jgi:tetratricopeptide (TPR) repeat protein
MDGSSIPTSMAARRATTRHGNAPVSSSERCAETTGSRLVSGVFEDGSSREGTFCKTSVPPWGSSHRNSFHRRTVKCGLMLLALVLGVWLPCLVNASQEFREGLDAAKAGRLEVAIEKWSKALERNPQSYPARANRGAAYMLTGHVSKAVDDWHEARKLAPLFAYSVYGGLFIPEVSRNAGMLNYAMSIELEPDYFPSVCMTGSMYLDFGQTQKASELFRKSIDLTRNPLLKTYLEYWAESLEPKPEE